MVKRILHVVTYMGKGGLETMIMNHYRHIDRTKIQFDFLVHRDFEADYDAEISALGGKIFYLPPLNPFSREYLSALDLFFEDHPEYKTVHCHLDCMSGIILRAAQKYGVPNRIAHAHSSNQTKDTKYLLKLYFKTLIPKYATELFACGKQAGEWMFGGHNFKIINNAIDTGLYRYSPDTASEVRGELGIPKDAVVLGHVGRFDPPKNHRFMLKMMLAVSDKRDDVYLLLVGDGELRERISELAVALGIRDRIIFAGVRNDVNRMLSAMDVFLMPSLYEGLPLSIIEAQSAALPCLISSGVPKECDKTGLVEQLSLEEGSEVWIEKALSMSAPDRKDVTDKIINAGFDIKNNAAELQKFYLEKEA